MQKPPNRRTPMPDIPEVTEARVLAAHLEWLQRESDEALQARRDLVVRLRHGGCTWPQVAELFGLSRQRIDQLRNAVRSQLDIERQAS